MRTKGSSSFSAATVHELLRIKIHMARLREDLETCIPIVAIHRYRVAEIEWIQDFSPTEGTKDTSLPSLFTKIERKDKIEDENRILVQQFQSRLTKELDTLHKTIAASVTQQEQQLNGMEEYMQSFVSTKA
ncbi:hypothetical protein CTI12_AA185910 [Artemisia annua]|uniref:Uncharacterized protein n=1 Tax=Artemisia annua TaxID=35608 RepID=A0A2U1NHM4_ARTAN|nr:hypothetical protein CTI12_AA185910 [Artemisia annua]